MVSINCCNTHTPEKKKKRLLSFFFAVGTLQTIYWKQDIVADVQV